MDLTSVSPGTGYCNGPYAGLTLGHGPNLNYPVTTATSLGTGFPPLYRDPYTMPVVSVLSYLWKRFSPYP